MLENSAGESQWQNITTSMTHISTNEEIPWRNYGDNLQRTNWISDLGVTCHTTAEISDFILGLLVETDKYIEVAFGHFTTAKNKGYVKIKLRYNNEKYSLLSYITCYWHQNCAMD